MLAIALWLCVFRFGFRLPLGIPAVFWHGHEMLYGFIAAAIAGFMLTAVPSWTRNRGFAGVPLIVLTFAWLAGRLAFAVSGAIPAPVLITLELLFLPALALLIAPSILRTTNRNTPMLLILFLFWALDVAFLRAVLHGDYLDAQRALHTGLNVVLLLITIVGGRIVPAFTSNALKARGIDVPMRRSRPLEIAVMGSMLALLGAGWFPEAHRVGGGVAAFASIAQLLRLLGWRGLYTRSDPIVWILHVAYLWIPIGLALNALHLLFGFAFAAHWFHALGAGAVATMILAVMTRTALGHTGRPLHATSAVTMAYILLVAAIVLRVFGGVLLPVGYTTAVTLAATLWLAAFLVFLIVYTPILFFRRADGKPG